jgi:hypothetical protein
VNDAEPVAGRGTIAVLRLSLLAIAALGIAGTAAELAIERHWQNLEQWYAWLALAIVTAGLIAMLRRWRASLWFARLCAVIAIAFAVVGVWRHINANYETAPLDFRYETRWDDMSVRERLWDVVTGEVGAAPILASGVLATIGIALGAATIGVPPPKRRPEPPMADEYLEAVE